jgi:hypothetical protein
MAKTYVKVSGTVIERILDYRDPRYQEIITNIPLDGYQEVSITDRQIDDFVWRGVELDVVDGAAVAHVPTPEEIERQLGEVRGKKIASIEAHDKSDAVNSFSVGGLAMWLDREERTSLARTIFLAAEAGDRTFSMWAPGEPPMRFDIPVEMAGPMLDALELYAKATYNTTQSHKAAVYALATVAEIETYDYTAGYPAKLEFNL